jgi:hypothetical protein
VIAIINNLVFENLFPFERFGLKGAVKKLFLQLLVLLIISFFFINPVFANNTGGWEFRSTETMEGCLTDKLKCNAETEFRFQDGDLYYSYTDFGLIYAVNKKVNIGTIYRQVYVNKNGKKTNDIRPFVNYIHTWNPGKFKIDSKSQIDWQFRFSGQNLLRFRQKVAVCYPIKTKRLIITPYISEELYIRLNGEHAGDLYRTRLMAGITTPLANRLKIDAYYLLQSSRNYRNPEDVELWFAKNIAGLKLKYDF